MSEFNIKAKAKINLSLDIISKRENGYHNLKMIMHTVNLCDNIIINETKDNKFLLKTNLSYLPNDSRNILYKTYIDFYNYTGLKAQGFNIGASLLIIAGVYLRFKKVYLVHIVHFVSCVAGAVLMFSNSAYGLIAEKQDFYRTTVLERGFFATVTENLKELAERFFAENIVTVSVFSLLLGVLCVLSAKTIDDSRKKRFGFAALNVNLICLVPFYCKGKLYDWDLFFESDAYAMITAAVLAVIAALYFISASVVVLVCVDCKKTKSKAMFLLLCIPMLIAPLMLVSPIGPRCFFPPYLMLMGICVLLFSYLQDKLSIDAVAVKRTGVMLLSVCAVMLSFLFGVYGVINWYDERRNELAKKQTDAGFKTVVMYYLPYTYYVWNADPDVEPWEDHYKQFHGIDEDVKLKFILRENFDDFEKNFEQ